MWSRQAVTKIYRRVMFAATLLLASNAAAGESICVEIAICKNSAVIFGANTWWCGGINTVQARIQPAWVTFPLDHSFACTRSVTLPSAADIGAAVKGEVATAVAAALAETRQGVSQDLVEREVALLELLRLEREKLEAEIALLRAQMKRLEEAISRPTP
jgi:hypothetical protein